jgi:uncharacterized Zn-finger protein/very-short-patch-repair endonuclease
MQFRKRLTATRASYLFELTRFLVEEMAKTSHACSVANCKQVFPSKSALATHSLTHGTLRQFKCEFPGCKAAFKQKVGLLRHKSKHSNDKPFSCDETGCGAVFKHKSGLTTHMITHSTFRFKCDEPGCEAEFTQNGALHNHKATAHSDERPFPCEEPGCGMAFKTKCILTAHMVSHSDAKDFKCEVPGCDAVFARKSGLQSHQITHTRERNFSCTEDGCTITFTQSSSLARHKLLHANVKKHVCEWPGCNRSFSQKSGLESHACTHDTARPYKCEESGCDATFKYSSSLAIHKKTHDPNRPPKVYSVGEKEVATILRDLGVEYLQEVRIGESRRRYDFGLVDFKMLIEFDGRHHFETAPFSWQNSAEEHEEALRQRVQVDMQKNEEAVQAGYMLLRIHFKAFKNMRRIIEHTIDEALDGKTGVVFSRKEAYEEVYEQYGSASDMEYDVDSCEVMVEDAE